MKPLPTTLFLSLTLTTLSHHISSLGSSFAAGPGLPPHSNYASLLAAKLPANHTDLSLSGSTLLDLPSQIARIPTDTDIVTLTSGGNDIGYIGGLMSEGLGVPARKSAVTREELVARFDKALGAVHARVPDARVYLVEYLTVLGGHVKPGVDVPFDEARVVYHRGVAKLLNEATREAARGKEWVEVVNSAEISAGHGVGSVVPWVNGGKGVRGDGIAWHPNGKGMEGAARKLYEKIRGRPRFSFRV